MRKVTLALYCFVSVVWANAQTNPYKESFEQFRNKKLQEYNSFREQINERYAEFLRGNWIPIELKPAEPEPADRTPTPPVIYEEPVELPPPIPEITEVVPVPKPEEQPVPEVVPVEPVPDVIPVEQVPEEPKPEPEPIVEEIQEPAPVKEPQPEQLPKIEITPVEVIPPKILPVVIADLQPRPIEPIREVPVKDGNSIGLSFYDLECDIRTPKGLQIGLTGTTADAIADAWLTLSRNDELNNTIMDCLELRENNGLSDWAYLQFLENFAKNVTKDTNEATLLMAFLFAQSGYQMRLGEEAGKLYMLYGSRHSIYKVPFYMVGERKFFPYGENVYALKICDVPFEGENPLSLMIPRAQNLGSILSEPKNIKSRRYPAMNTNVVVPKALIEFYDGYPRSTYDNDFMTTWAILAQTPLSEETKDMLYPQLESVLNVGTELEQVSKILNWIQTGIVYEYDEVVWGDDRPFFTEETLYYPYADCEDRSILLSRLVRDIIGLDVALVYYPGHLAAAVAFNEDVKGDALNINGRRFVICDPTYIGAPVGKQMPGFDLSTTEAIVLN